MYLHEYQTKKILSYYGLSIPIGYICTSISEVEQSISMFENGPWIIKCQIHAGGRGKVGGVKSVNTKEEIIAFANKWLGKRLVTCQTDSYGKPVNILLIEELIHSVIKELYVGVTIDYTFNRILFIASNKGGIEIEENNNLIYKIYIDPLIGPMPYQGRELLFKLGLDISLLHKFIKIFTSLVTIFLELDLIFIEINPLAITTQGNLICLDGKLEIDNNALFRQQKIYDMRDKSQDNILESKISNYKLNYIALEGNIGCIVNGAGLAMSTMDIIKFYGGEPANFLDIGGSANKDCIVEAFQMIINDKKVKAILVNIFGGIVRCDIISDGIVEAIEKINIRIPIIVRFEGNNCILGQKKLIDYNSTIFTTKNLKDAVSKVVSIAKEL